MKIVLATGIYPPEIGGPATYVHRLARLLTERGAKVTVIAYGSSGEQDADIPVIRVSRTGGPLSRWRRYARELKEHGKDADIVYAFSSVSCGVPLWLAGLKHPKKLLRLGGDFLWERYTDRGGDSSLRAWYKSEPWLKGMMNGVLRHFDHIVFSTEFQQTLYESSYARLPLHSVIENTLPEGVPVYHSPHDPFRLLFLGRFVSFKNLGSLILALHEAPGMSLTIAGSGPLEEALHALIQKEEMGDRVTIVPPVSGDAKQHLFLDHDLLVLPSYTEISPNTALEARAAGLPVLLTEETGLSTTLTTGAMLRTLRSPIEIAAALREARETYEPLAERAASPIPARTWDDLADEHMELFRNLL